MALQIAQIYLARMGVGLEASVSEDKSLFSLTLRGWLTSSNRSKARFYFTELVTDEARCVVLDLQGLQKLDAAGLRVLTDFIRNLTQRKIPIYAYGMSDEIYDILDFVDFRGNLTLLPDKSAFDKVLGNSIPEIP